MFSNEFRSFWGVEGGGGRSVDLALAGSPPDLETNKTLPCVSSFLRAATPAVSESTAFLKLVRGSSRGSGEGQGEG